jgi:hypothetical protein
MPKRRWLILLLALSLFTLLAIILYQIPAINNTLSWRVENIRTQIRHALNPPGDAVFIPQEQVKSDLTPDPVAEKSTLTLTPTTTQTTSPTQPGPTSTPTPTPTPTQSPTLIPGVVVLSGVIHEYQQMNNCGPATLSMALSYWGWRGDQRDTRAYLRPNFATIDDKNVSPYEMAAFVETQTDFSAIVRVGGDIELLKRIIAAGFPVIIEKGFQPPKEDWMGHYELITGYDDTRARFITQDAYIMADFTVPYTELADRWWRDFNHIDLVIYPPDREAEVLSILNSQADLLQNLTHAAQNAHQEIGTLSGRDLFFAWFNLGTNLIRIADYTGAANAYDQAFQVYASLSGEERPWRMLWYQFGPYEAYIHTGRFQDVISLANQTLSFLQSPVLEESLYWRGLAKEGLGDIEGAVTDLKRAVEINPTSTDVLDQLQRLGFTFP